MFLVRIAQFLFFSLFAANFVLAQASLKDYQQNCVNAQVAEHKGLQGKKLTSEDFDAYCSCQSEFVSKNATNNQINELLMNPKAKPEWLKAMELKAMKSCITDSKMST